MTIEQRLDVLERDVRDGARQVRRWRTWALGSAAALVAVCAMGARQSSQPIHDVIQARSFEVVDDSGVVLARLGPSKGDGSIMLFDRNGRPQFVVNMTSRGEAVLMADQAGRLNRIVMDRDTTNGIVYPDRGDTPD
jgi:hypothetical protein